MVLPRKVPQAASSSGSWFLLTPDLQKEPGPRKRWVRRQPQFGRFWCLVYIVHWSVCLTSYTRLFSGTTSPPLAITWFKVEFFALCRAGGGAGPLPRAVPKGYGPRCLGRFLILQHRKAFGGGREGTLTLEKGKGKNLVKSKAASGLCCPLVVTCCAKAGPES